MPANHHVGCCAEREKTTFLQFANFRGTREFTTLLKATVQQQAWQALNREAFAGQFEHYTQQELCQFLDP